MEATSRFFCVYLVFRVSADLIEIEGERGKTAANIYLRTFIRESTFLPQLKGIVGNLLRVREH